jgi:death-on-curing protein
MFSDDPNEDLEIITYIHDEIIEASGGSKGYHNEGLVRSALARPLQSVMGKDAYSTYFQRAAALLDSIANNHGFRDGNKRTAMAVASYYLDDNDIQVNYSNDEYEEIMLHVVNNKPSVHEIAQWLEDHSSPIPPTPWVLLNVRKQAKKYPDTFHIPFEEDIDALKIGSIIKLIFHIEDESVGGERMWVLITEINNDEFVGELDSSPTIIRGLHYKDKISFKAEHIASIWDDEN